MGLWNKLFGGKEEKQVENAISDSGSVKTTYMMKYCIDWKSTTSDKDFISFFLLFSCESNFPNNIFCVSLIPFILL